MMDRTIVLILMLPLVAVLLLVACMPASTSTPLSPAATPIPAAISPSVLPTATPVVEEVQAKAWVSSSRPGWGSTQTVYGALTREGDGVAGARMYSVVHDQDSERRWPSEGFEITGQDGMASVSFIVMETTASAVVQVDVYLIYQGITYKTGASFTPTC